MIFLTSCSHSIEGDVGDTIITRNLTNSSSRAVIKYIQVVLENPFENFVTTMVLGSISKLINRKVL